MSIFRLVCYFMECFGIFVKSKSLYGLRFQKQVCWVVRGWEIFFAIKSLDGFLGQISLFDRGCLGVRRGVYSWKYLSFVFGFFIGVVCSKLFDFLIVFLEDRGRYEDEMRRRVSLVGRFWFVLLDFLLAFDVMDLFFFRSAFFVRFVFSRFFFTLVVFQWFLCGQDGQAFLEVWCGLGGQFVFVVFFGQCVWVDCFFSFLVVDVFFFWSVF